jgi:hypothetical protein
MRTQKGHQNVSFCTPMFFSQMKIRSLFRMAGTTRLELATSAVTDFTAPIATFGAPRNPREFLLHPDCTQFVQFCFRKFPFDFPQASASNSIPNICFKAKDKRKRDRAIIPVCGYDQLPPRVAYRGSAPSRAEP